MRAIINNLKIHQSMVYSEFAIIILELPQLKDGIKTCNPLQLHSFIFYLLSLNVRINAYDSVWYRCAYIGSELISYLALNNLNDKIKYQRNHCKCYNKKNWLTNGDYLFKSYWSISIGCASSRREYSWSFVCMHWNTKHKSQFIRSS